MKETTFNEAELALIKTLFKEDISSQIQKWKSDSLSYDFSEDLYQMSQGELMTFFIKLQDSNLVLL